MSGQGELSIIVAQTAKLMKKPFFEIPAVSIMLSGIEYNIPGGQSMHISTFGSKVNKL